MKPLGEYDIPELEDLLEAQALPRSAARKLLRHYYDNGGESIDRVEIARRLREQLNVGPLRALSLLARREASDGTIKLLLAAQSSSVECVLMPSHRADRAAGCVSSQVGCAMGCDFCASTKSGVERNLSSGEIVEQFLWLRGEALRLGRRLQTVVFMGMGEPLLNYENVVAAIRRIAGQELGALGWRQVTVSTVGIVPGIDRLREENLGVQLAVSLHAPNDATRAAIVPTGKRFGVEEILDAAARYQQSSGRVVNIEYCLLDGVNDSDDQARLLAARLAGRGMHVNLIPYNWIGPGLSGRVYQRPADERMERFVEILTAGGVVAHFRRPRGEDIEGACGQLRERITGD